MQQSRLRWVLSLLLVAAGLLGAPGCARNPAGQGNGGAGPQLVITMQVAGQIRPDYFYFVLFNVVPSTVSSSGPIPKVTQPWGNGFATGAFTSFVRYDGTQPNGGYGVYSVVPGSDLLSFQYLGTPVSFTPVASGGSTLQFQIPLSQLATPAVPASQIGQIQVNFINTNRIPVDPNDPGTKLFDAIGDARLVGGVNNPLTVPTAQAGLFQNSQLVPPEPEGDVVQAGNGTLVSNNDPDLDIVNWTIRVVR